jgi:hypothetical protein
MFQVKNYKRSGSYIPWGAQTLIAKRLSTKENKVTPQDVNRSLHGRKLRHGEVAARIL